LPENVKRPTRADVARLANVSETIVSYVINGQRYVDSQKRKRVQEAIKALNYRPNNIARALKGKSTNSILFIADQISNEHFSQIITEMDSYAYHKGCLISLCANRNDEDFLSQVMCRDYDGIIISSISFREDYINRLVEAAIPVVLLMNRQYPHVTDGVGRIYTGLYYGAKECVKHLYDRGRRHIVYIDRYSQRGHFSTMDDLRYQGFVESCQELGLERHDMISGCADEAQVIEAVKAYLASGRKVDAFFGRNDKLACLAMNACQEAGLAVPQDIAIIGFDNSTISRFVTPKLTTMEMPRGDIGRAAIEMLYQMIEGKHPEDVNLQCKLIQRQSTAV